MLSVCMRRLNTSVCGQRACQVVRMELQETSYADLMKRRYSDCMFNDVNRKVIIKLYCHVLNRNLKTENKLTEKKVC